MRSEAEMLKKKVLRMVEKIEDVEAYERKDTLIFFGKAVNQVTEGEICTQLACGLLKEQTSNQIPETLPSNCADAI